MAVLTIPLPVIVTVVLSNYQTQRITRAATETSNRQTQRIIRNSNRQARQIIETYNQQTLKLLREIERIQEDTRCLREQMHRCLLKLDFEVNAWMHGWRRVGNVSTERVRELPEPQVYSPKLRICYYKLES